MFQIRHGDVFVQAVAAIPEDAKPHEGLVLAYGEVTGHKHQLDIGEMFETKDGKLYFRLKKTGHLRHEEHKEIALPPGNYEVIHQKEYHPQEIRRVAD